MPLWLELGLSFFVGKEGLLGVTELYGMWRQTECIKGRMLFHSENRRDCRGGTRPLGLPSGHMESVVGLGWGEMALVQ